MKKQLLLLGFLFFLSCLCGYFLSKASLVGRIGINLFYKQYKFLKIWWHGALLIFIILVIFMFLQGIIQKKLPVLKARMVHIAMIMLAIIGLYLTFYDFRHTTTHRWLGERFHIGGYLFWLGWICISIFYLLQRDLRSEILEPVIHAPINDPLQTEA